MKDIYTDKEMEEVNQRLDEASTQVAHETKELLHSVRGLCDDLQEKLEPQSDEEEDKACVLLDKQELECLRSACDMLLAHPSRGEWCEKNYCLTIYNDSIRVDCFNRQNLCVNFKYSR